MSWLESHQELRDHPKTARLRRRLGVSLPAVIGHLHLFWWWALDYAPHGDLSRFDADVIADAAAWEADPGTFVRALIAAGFLDDDLKIHDWDDYAGRLIDKREANARRMRAARYARRAELGDTAYAARPADGTPDVQRTSTGRVRPPDLTVPNLNRTGPDPSPQPPPHAEGAPPRRRKGGTAEASGDAELAPLSADDAALWATARHAAGSDMSPANAEKVAALEPVGRGPDGGLRLRAPPEYGDLRRFGAVLARALCDAGDAAGWNVAIVTG